MHPELSDWVGLTHQPKELPLGGRQGGVWHHVQKADMQLTNLLIQGPLGAQYGDALLTQAGKSG